MPNIETPNLSKSYLNHPVFDEIENIKTFYDGIAYTCTSITTHTTTILNYDSDVFYAIFNTIDSIKVLLKIGRINDVYVLVRKYFDDVLVETYIDVTLKDKSDIWTNIFVDDVEAWLNERHRIPKMEKLLKILKESDRSKDLYPYFGWETYLKHNREFLDDSVHGNRFSRYVLNCNTYYIERENHLKNIHLLLKQIFTMHLSFIFYLNADYIMATDYIDYIEMNLPPPNGSEFWLASYAQDAFDRYIKPNKSLASFIKGHCGMEIM